MQWSEEVSADPALADFSFIAHPRARILVRQGYASTAEVLLDGLAGRVIEWVGGGRDKHPVVELAGGERFVVRRYWRGGALKRLNRDVYFLGNRALREVQVTERSARGGVRVPVIIAAIERPGLIGYTAELVTLWMEGACELAGWLRGSSGREVAALSAVGEEIRKMHAAGVAHPDLNLRNFMVAPGLTPDEFEIYVIDFDRGRIYTGAVPGPRRRRDLLRLRRSAHKLEVPIGALGWAALSESYGSGWPLPVPLG